MLFSRRITVTGASAHVGVLQARLKAELRTNSYDPGCDSIVLSNDRAAAVRQVAPHYEALFGDGSPAPRS